MYMTMIPRLEAEAQLSAARVGMVSWSLQLEQRDAEGWFADRDRVAAGIAEAPPAPKATPAALAAMGIGVVMVEAADV